MVAMKNSDLVMEQNGNLLVLVSGDGESDFTLTRCSASGTPLEAIQVRNLPREFRTNFSPSSLYIEAGVIGLVDQERGKVAIIDAHGQFRQLSGDRIHCTGNGQRQGVSRSGSLSSTLLRFVCQVIS